MKARGFLGLWSTILIIMKRNKVFSRNEAKEKRINILCK